MNSTQCYHCGDAVLERAPIRSMLDGQERRFCCAGCRAAAEWLHQGGFGDYYRLRSEQTGHVEAGQDFADWDSAGFQRLYVDRREGLSECHVSIDQIRCAACAWLIDRVGQGIPGVQAIQADPSTTLTRIRFDPARVALSTIAQRLAAIGYAPRVIRNAEDEKRQRRQSLKRLVVAALGAMQAMMFTEALYWGAGQLDPGTRDFFRIIAMLVATPVVFYSGMPFFRGAARELLLRRPGMDLLVALSVGLAYLASVIETVRGGPVVYFDAAVMFVALLSATRHAESMARQRASERLRLIADSRHQHAERIDREGRITTTAISELEVGDQIRVASGESVPVDGQLQDTRARLDESLLTGEAEPVEHPAGATILAGSIALDAPLRIVVTAVGTATRLGQLRARIGAGLHARADAAAPGQRLAARFTLAMLLLAAATAVYWLLNDPALVLPATLSVLAAACPCAFALAVPASQAAAQSQLAKQGVIIASAKALANAAEIDHIVCDKTGTLSEGRPRLLRIDMSGTESNQSRALAIAAALERGHRHPLALTFKEFDVGLDVAHARAVPGFGVTGQIDAEEWRLGRGDWLGVDDANAVVLASADRVVARFFLADPLRPEAAQAVREWRRYAPVTILSGDHPEAVAEVESTLGVDGHARLDPDQKRAEILALRAQGHRVMMIGDGLNDAESLAAADLGVAMGSGSAIAQCHADVLLLRNDLRLLKPLLDVARRTRKIARQNFAWSIAYHAAIVPFAVSGTMSPWLAAVGMAASSLLVTLNALRLRIARPEAPPATAAELPA